MKKKLFLSLTFFLLISFSLYAKNKNNSTDSLNIIPIPYQVTLVACDIYAKDMLNGYLDIRESKPYLTRHKQLMNVLKTQKAYDVNLEQYYLEGYTIMYNYYKKYPTKDRYDLTYRILLFSNMKCFKDLSNKYLKIDYNKKIEFGLFNCYVNSSIKNIGYKAGEQHLTPEQTHKMLVNHLRERIGGTDDIINKFIDTYYKLIQLGIDMYKSNPNLNTENYVKEIVIHFDMPCIYGELLSYFKKK
ncbi:hypothetical protein DEFDS_P159 (plasmid) [Deferribacter desulfuricans SSM1]|uniref:Uncharacterized protein n=1 Tax=Deferribacter desulfuricans (strain DSM 14783 / JCM 11476 / NBRC 101012 / SSM1) TaxID=639282 RepID=D3PEY8_DEFDS|nr:hypothetical protein [Deferribacter desulfuricans]BAI81780.1 hypothetical protein DEFDS_P159 [Deferribacter desulfuricans SSM1]